MTSPSWSEGWYPAVEGYYVTEPDPALYPVRQGDLMLPPEETPISSKKPWLACLVVHPSCDLGAKSHPSDLQVVRVLALRSASEKSRPDIVLGMRKVDGEARVASANTFFLPPVARLHEPMYADFHQPARIPRAELSVDRRVAALTHNARLYFIRRKLYWEQRWFMALEDVLGFEKVRIAGDSAFVGDKPEWARSDIA